MIYVVYRPGMIEGPGFEMIMKKISQEIDMGQANGQYQNLIGLGDFNFPNAKWTTGMLPSNLQTISHEGKQFNILIDFMKEHLLFQLVRDPTRINNIVDLIIVNNEDIVQSYKQEINVGLSDHNTINIGMNIYPGNLKNRTINKNYYKTQIYKYDLSLNNIERWEHFEELMNHDDWSDSPAADDPESNEKTTPPEKTLGGMSTERTLVEQMNYRLTRNIENNVKIAFKLKNDKGRGNKIPSKVRKLMREKNKISRRLMKSKDGFTITNLRRRLGEVEEELKERYNKMRRNKEDKVIPLIIDEPATF